MRIIAHSYINPKGLWLNNHCVKSTIGEENWLKAMYQHIGVEYPKFYKMDDLSKMSFLTGELLRSFIPKEVDQENDLALIFANHTSSQFTDIKFHQSYIIQGNPSPSLFVYTLPNILTGELCIRNKWYGENCFYISESFDAQLYIDQIQFAFNHGNSCCLCGWVEAKTDGSHECFLFLVLPSEEKLDFITLNNLYKTYKNE
jgi:hypothetical protein